MQRYLYDNVKKELIIDDSVTQIECFEFANNFFENDIKKVVFPKGLQAIGAYAFKMQKISKLYLPESLEYIGAYAFYKCPLEGKIVLPFNLKRIGDYAFCYKKIKKIIVPKKCQYKCLTDEHVEIVKKTKEEIPNMKKLSLKKK